MRWGAWDGGGAGDDGAGTDAGARRSGPASTTAAAPSPNSPEATMFAREAQGVWPELAPVFDKKALQGAEKLGLPQDPEELARLVSGSTEPPAAAELPADALVDLPTFAAFLVKVALSID